jgi:uncharacterized protein (TIRG00374 family)
VSLWLICGHLGVDLGLWSAVFVYAAATLAGAAAFLPGGLGGTEAVLVLLLVSQGAARGTALSASFLVRLLTLWLAVAIGVAVIWAARRSLFGTGVPATRDGPSGRDGP